MTQLQIFPNAQTFLINEVSVSLSLNNFANPQFINIQAGVGELEGQNLLTFGRGDCKTTLSNFQVKQLTDTFGIKII